MDAEEESHFRELFNTSPVPDDYADINKGFIDHIVRSHNEGEDPFGYFTIKKVVYTLYEDSEIVGFTVTTWKRGGSVKFGPTVLNEQHQGKGLGPKLRRMIDDSLRSDGLRKSYSTIPENANYAFKYLVKAGHKVEAHLKNQYSTDHSELVFGRVLNGDANQPINCPDRETRDELDFSVGTAEFDGFSDFVVEEMQPWYDNIDREFADSVQRGEDRGFNSEFSKKGKRVYIGHESGEITSVAICSTKRGGAIKISPILSSVKGPALTEFINRVEADLQEIGDYRKFYTLVSFGDNDLVSALKEHQYDPEGLLRQPYKPGIDMVFLGKILQ